MSEIGTEELLLKFMKDMHQRFDELEARMIGISTDSREINEQMSCSSSRARAGCIGARAE